MFFAKKYDLNLIIRPAKIYSMRLCTHCRNCWFRDYLKRKFIILRINIQFRYVVICPLTGHITIWWISQRNMKIFLYILNIEDFFKKTNCLSLHASVTGNKLILNFLEKKEFDRNTGCEPYPTLLRFQSRSLGLPIVESYTKTLFRKENCSITCNSEQMLYVVTFLFVWWPMQVFDISGENYWILRQMWALNKRTHC